MATSEEDHRKQGSCGICGTDNVELKELPCLHETCHDCLVRFQRDQKISAYQIQCPDKKCQQKFSVQPGALAAFKDANDIELVPRVKEFPPLTQMEVPSKVRAMIVVDTEMFIACSYSNLVLVFEANTEEFQMSFVVAGLSDPGCMAATNEFLFIREYMRETVYRVPLTDRSRSVPLVFQDMAIEAMLSSTERGTILVPLVSESVLEHGSMIGDYSSDGTLIQRIKVHSEKIGLYQAVEIYDLNSNKCPIMMALTFLSPTSSILTIDDKGYPIDVWNGIGRYPLDFVLDRRTGGIMVCCKCSNEIILLNTKLTEIYPNLASTTDIKRCSVIAFDEELRNLFVADAETRKIVLIKMFWYN